MEMNKKYSIAIILSIIIIAGFLIYRYEWRLSKIRKECSDQYLNYYESTNRIGRLAPSSGEEAYIKCLAENGFKK